MVRLPKIIGDTWFNLPEGKSALTEDDFKGKVVLIDFWTYSCVNCKRTLPYLREWWNRYKDKDFLIVGIHTPEFEFEKNPENVKQAIEDLGVNWPVVLDNEQKNWQAFANRFWPAKYLADKDGKIAYTHFGEGAYQKTEDEIRKLLNFEPEENTTKPLPEHEHGNVCFIPTPEAYSGYKRGHLANKGGYIEEEVAEYEEPKEIKDGEVGLSGKFLASGEYVQSCEAGATLFLRFHATEVNLVLEPVEESAVIEIGFSGQMSSPPNEVYGHDVKGDLVKIEKARMYNLLRSSNLMDGTIKIKAKDGNFKAYAFTFSGCEH